MKGIAGYQWTLGKVKDLIMEQFWTWAKLDGLGLDGTAYSGADRYIDLTKRFGSSWGRSCVRNIGESSRITSNIFTLIL